MCARYVSMLSVLAVLSGCTKPVRDTPIPPPSVASHDAGATAMVYCRAMKSNGDVLAGAKAIHEGDPVERNQWLDLAPNAMVIVKEAGSGREVRVSGPGRARMCVGKDMQTWLISGYFDALTMGSEPAGSQRILATPYGAVRFGAARVRATVKTDGVDLEVDAGTVEAVAEHIRSAPGTAGTPAGDAGAQHAKHDAGRGAAAATPLYMPAPVGAGERVKLHGAADLSATLCISVSAAVDAITMRMTVAAKGGAPQAGTQDPLGSLAEQMTRTESARRLTCAWAYAARGGLRGTGTLDGGTPTWSRAFKALPEDPDMPKD